MRGTEGGKKGGGKRGERWVQRGKAGGGPCDSLQALACPGKPWRVLSRAMMLSNIVQESLWFLQEGKSRRKTNQGTVATHTNDET